MDNICDKKKCTGCMACYNICPQKAINMELIDGFYYPSIDVQKCIDCGLCKRTCPILNNIKKNPPIDKKAYAVLNKNKEIRDTSSSGGVFFNLAQYIISQNGIVYGAAWTNDLKVNHIRIEKSSDIKLLQGSKYVQSYILDSYKQVKKDLDNNKPVLFSGVPCQIAGLKSFLKKTYQNLYTCEVLCHGSASPQIFEEHKIFLEKKYNSRLEKVNFRRKTLKKCQNIEYIFKNGKKIIIEEPNSDYYYLGFQDGTIDRDSCSNCNFIGIERCSDITLADFWGLKDNRFKCKDELSYPSLVFTNTKKGTELFDMIKKDFEIIERPLEEAIWGNLSLRRATPYNKYKDKFFKEYYSNGYMNAAKKYLVTKKDYKYYIKKILGSKLTRVLIKVTKR